jgi:cyclic dehypoxanthinyl futalosine synthase
MNTDIILQKAINLEPLTLEEGLYIYSYATTGELMMAAHECRSIQVPGKKVGWIIDRNINITNVCISGCKFCNFHCGINDPVQYVTTIPEYINKIKELRAAGGNQLLLQGGLNPRLGINFYTSLFSELKNRFPGLKLHALGPPEIVFLARKERKSYREILDKLTESGMDSLPGAGAEILSDRVRRIISPGKCKTTEWLEVMREAHKMNLVTSATMMFGHIETPEERIQHLIYLRQVQSEKPDGHYGFVTFIPWPFMDEGTVLQSEGIINQTTANDYIRLVAISRMMLNNIKNIQASWLTTGVETASLCLFGGANDFGSVMMEENVVSAAGAKFIMDADGICRAISGAGFEPQYRNQAYEPEEFPGINDI